MWKKMAGRLFELQSRNGILEEKDRRLYEYAYGCLLYTSLEELRLDVTGTFLEELDEQNQEVEFRELMTNSVWYRCV